MSGAFIESKLRSWVGSQIEDYLGEKEETMVDFVIGKVAKRSPPEAIIEELKMCSIVTLAV